MKKISDFFAPLAKKRQVDGDCINPIDVQLLRESYFAAAFQGSRTFSSHNKQA